MNEHDEMTTHVPEEWQHQPPPVPARRRTYELKGATIGAIGAILLLTCVLGILLANWIERTVEFRPTRPKGGYWNYDVEDVSVQANLSAEMNLLEREEFTASLLRHGDGGFELVSIIRVPSRYDSDHWWHYRLVFKRPADRTNDMPAFDQARFQKAQAAESKAFEEKVRKSIAH